jgi:hypothetical protein
MAILLQAGCQRAHFLCRSWSNAGDALASASQDRQDWSQPGRAGIEAIFSAAFDPHIALDW